MRVLALSLYGSLAATTRHRLLQYRDRWAAHGIDLVVVPLLGDRYLSARFGGSRRPWAYVLRQYVKRLLGTLADRRFDLVIVTHELLPYAPAWLERLLHAGRAPYVLDIDDAAFHKYDQHGSRWVRWALGEKIARVCSGASAVFAGSDYLAEWCQRWNPHVHFVPTQVDTQSYVPREPRKRGEPFVIGWMGSPSTAPFLKSVSVPLAAAEQRLDARLLIIGGGSFRLPDVRAEYRPWSLEREVADLQEMSVGIMPLEDTPFARGKCAFKLLQYMACAVPVVASPVGMNTRLVVDSGGGRLAQDADSWLRAFTELREGPEMAAALGQAGRREVERGYSLDVLAPRTAEWLADAYQRGRRAQGD